MVSFHSLVNQLPLFKEADSSTSKRVNENISSSIWKHRSRILPFAHLRILGLSLFAYLVEGTLPVYLRTMGPYGLFRITPTILLRCEIPNVWTDCIFKT